MKTLTEIEREARRTRDLIDELKGHTPRFNATKERAEEELSAHLAKIDTEREHLGDLKDAASLIVQHLGADVPPEVIAEAMIEAGTMEPETTEAELAAVMAEDVEAVVAMADSPQESAGAWLETQFEAQELGEPSPLDDAPTFETIGAIAAEITAAVEQMASDPPATDDQSEADEMTDEQVERKELELAEAAPRAPKLFNAFAANPFA